MAAYLSVLPEESYSGAYLLAVSADGVPHPERPNASNAQWLLEEYVAEAESDYSVAMVTVTEARTRPPGEVTAWPPGTTPSTFGGSGPGNLSGVNATMEPWEGDLWEYLQVILGPQRQALHVVVPITVIYIIIFIFGLLGNVSTCVVIARNRFMQTATNYYLFNLAISDLLMLVLGLPQETYIFWFQYPYIFGEAFCAIRTMAAETSTNASILTITAFTAERYMAICHPMRSQRQSSLRRAVKIIVTIWVISGACAVPMVIQFGITYISDPSGRVVLESAQCSIKTSFRHAFEVSTFLFFITPMTIITVLYVLIGLAIRRSSLRRAGSDSSQHSQQTGNELRALQQARARRAVIKMLVAVVVAFFICWLPFHAQRLIALYTPQEHYTAAINHWMHVFYPVSGVLYYVISVVNPLLYNIMSLKFRQAFMNTIFRSCRQRHQRLMPTVLRTYRFHNRHCATDTNLTLLHANGYAAKLRAARPHTDPKYVAAASHSSSVGSTGSGHGKLHLVGPGPGPGPGPGQGSGTDPGGLELGPPSHSPLEPGESSTQDAKSHHSYHFNHRESPTTNSSSRPYHSYA